MERKFKVIPLGLSETGKKKAFEIVIYRATPEEFAKFREHPLTQILNFIPHPPQPGSEVKYYETSTKVTGPISRSVPDLTKIAKEKEIDIETVRDFTIGQSKQYNIIHNYAGI